MPDESSKLYKALIAIKNSYLYCCLNEVNIFGCITENFITVQTLTSVFLRKKRLFNSANAHRCSSNMNKV